MTTKTIAIGAAAVAALVWVSRPSERAIDTSMSTDDLVDTLEQNTPKRAPSAFTLPVGGIVVGGVVFFLLWRFVP